MIVIVSGPGEPMALGFADMSFPPPTPVDRGAPEDPMSGHLTPGWSILFALGWAGVGAGMAGVWRASWQLGLPTWWLAPGTLRPFTTTLAMAAPITLVIASLRRVRWLPWLGIVGAVVVGAIALGDAARVPRLAVAEAVLAVAGLLISLAALAGIERFPQADDDGSSPHRGSFGRP